MEKHAPPFVMSAEQQLEHSLCLFDAPIVRRVPQQLEHGFCKYNEKSCSIYSDEGWITAGTWSLLVLWETMLCLLSWELTSCRAWSLYVLLKFVLRLFSRDWEKYLLRRQKIMLHLIYVSSTKLWNVFVSSMGNHTQPVVMKFEQQLENTLWTFHWNIHSVFVFMRVGQQLENDSCQQYAQTMSLLMLRVLNKSWAWSC